jgi:hypothetical protein
MMAELDTGVGVAPDEPTLTVLAWGDEPTADVEPTVRQSWPRTCNWAGAVLLAAVVAAAGIVAVWLADPTNSSSAPPMAVPSSTPPIPMQDELPVVLPSLPDVSRMADPDQVYLAALRDQHSELYVTDASGFVAARAQCAVLASHDGSVTDTATLLRQQYSGLTPADAVAMVEAAARAYCPQYA